MHFLLGASLAALAWVTVTAAQANVGRRYAVNSAGEPARRVSASEQDAHQIEVDRFKAARISLREAIAVAQSRHEGSRAVDASFDGEADVATYQIRTSLGNRVWENTVDAQTGKTIKAELVWSVEDLGSSDRMLLTSLRAVRQGLSDAIVVAERNTLGRAIGAGLAVEQDRLQFVVVCVSGTDLKQVLLEPPVAPVRSKGSSNRKVLSE